MKCSKNDKLDCLIQLAYLQCGAKDAALFDETNGSEVPVPESLSRKIMRLIDRKSREKTVGRTKLIVGRVAVAAMLIMSIMFTMLISVSGIREAIWRAIVEWHENYITIRFENPEEENDAQNTVADTATETENNTDEEASSETKTGSSLENQKTVTPPPTVIEEVRKPTYLMEGVIEDLFKTQTSTNIDYYIDNEIVYYFSQFVLDENRKYVDNETALVEQIYINEYNASLVTYSNQSETTIVWSDGEYVYVLASSVINVEQMITIAESVRAE